MTYVPTAGSLFSGVGMMDYAFAQAGFDIRFQVEIDPYCRKVLSKHAPTYWPNAELHADVRDVRGQQLGYVDVLFGGFPCQSISNAGTRAGIQAGTASGLWFEFRRLIGDIRPKVVLLENVAAITRRDGIKVISDLTSLGYDCRWGVISASDVGAPHQRDRWWCVAFNMEHTNSKRCEELDTSTLKGASSLRPGERLVFDGTSPRWYENQSRLDRSADGTAVRVDRRHGMIVKHEWSAPPGLTPPVTEVPRMAVGKPNTNARLKALGNGAVPQIVYPIDLYLKGMLKHS